MFQDSALTHFNSIARGILIERRIRQHRYGSEQNHGFAGSFQSVSPSSRPTYSKGFFEMGSMLTFRVSWSILFMIFLCSCGEVESRDEDIEDIIEDGPLQVQTIYGPVLGEVADSSRVFRGVPYAAPPVGPLRFASPQPPDPWDDPPPAESTLCPQMGVDGVIYGDEDCLTLDVWTPLKTSKHPLPVMVWIHGGWYWYLSGSGYLSDAMLPTRDVIVVAINYRLGLFGFFAHPDLTEEGGGTSGNYGFEDQIFALEWVQDNVSAFGGDPEQVTIFGGSSGGRSVGSHLGSPNSAGLFHRAIMQSGNGFESNKLPLTQVEAQGQRLADAVSCSTEPNVAECLRRLPMERFFDISLLADSVFAGPNLDGVIFERDLAEMVEAGDFNQVPVIIGSNMYEALQFFTDMSLIIGSDLNALTEEQYEAFVGLLVGEDADEVLSLYPMSDYGTSLLALTVSLSNRFFTCPARRAARLLTEAGSDVYLYHFNQGWALHGDELRFLFGIGALPSDQLVSSAMKDYWTTFAKNGDPNRGGYPPWPRYEESTDQHLALTDPVGAGSHLFKEECDFWQGR